MKILGLTGNKGSGKDTIADFIINNNAHLKIVKIGFADALKREVAEGCGVSTQYIAEHKDNFRLILQGWGTDFRRKLYGDDYWIKKWMQSANSLEPAVDIIIVNDVRFLNEASMLKELDAKLVRVRREYNEDKHASEVELEQIRVDHEIHNKFITLVQLETEAIASFCLLFPTL